MQNNNTLKINTRVIHASQRLDDDKGSIMPVIYPSAIFEKKNI